MMIKKTGFGIHFVNDEDLILETNHVIREIKLHGSESLTEKLNKEINFLENNKFKLEDIYISDLLQLLEISSFELVAELFQLEAGLPLSCIETDSGMYLLFEFANTLGTSPEKNLVKSSLEMMLSNLLARLGADVSEVCFAQYVCEIPDPDGTDDHETEWPKLTEERKLPF